jgi:nickel transport protein
MKRLSEFGPAVRVRSKINLRFQVLRRPHGKARGGRIAGYLTNEQRSRAGWIGSSKCEVIFERALISLSFFLLVLLSPARPTLAHKVNIFAYTEGDTVFTESYFSDGKKCVNSQVTVFDEGGKKLLEGKTDKKGLFSFKTPAYTDLRLVLTASMGHRAEYVVSKTGIPDAGLNQNNGRPPADMKELQSLIEASLDRKLAPMKQMIARMEQDRGPAVVEIVGGIGYIFGIMGIIVLVKNRKNRYRPSPK